MILSSIYAKIGLAVGVFVLVAGILFGAYHIGYTKGANLSRVQISQYEAKSNALAAKLATAQGKIDVQTVTKYQDRVQYVDRVSTRTKTVIETKVPEQFTLSTGWVKAYNASAAGRDLAEAEAADATPSGVTDRQALDVINDNNATYLQVKNRLDSLQDWIENTEKSRESITDSKPANAGGVQHP